MITVSNLCEYLKIYAPAWVTATAYTKGQYVTSSSVVYVCLIAHTSGVFATDLTNLNWRAVSILTTAAAHGVAYVKRGTNGRVFEAGNYTEEMPGNGQTTMFMREIVTTITTIKYWDEDTDAYITIFEGSDTIANSTYITGVDFGITLTNGYTWESTKLYEIVYAGGAGAPQDLKTVAIEAGVRYYLNSPEGNAWFGKSSQNVGTQATSSTGIESEKEMIERHTVVMDYYRIINI